MVIEIGVVLLYGVRGRGRMVFDFLKYPEQADDEVGAVHDQPDTDKTYQG